MSYYVATTKTKATKKQAAEIRRLIAEIDNDAVFVSVSIPGNDIKGWIERPNDGTNDYNFRRANNRRMAEIMHGIIG